jgi:c-di-GMP-binding flagellar brake protein YcgR
MNDPQSNFIEELKSKININDLLQVRIIEEANSPTYHSRVNDISEGRLVIAWPTSGGMRLLIHEDQIFEFTFIKDGIPHAFNGLVDETRVQPLPEITIILSSLITQIQRRQDFRIKCLIPVEVVGNIKEDPQSEATSAFNVKTVSNDLSASGISVRLSKRLPENALLNIKVTLPDDGQPISIPCTVVYSDYQTENQILYRTGMRYLALSASERARIVRFLYRTQLQRLHP